MVESKFEERAMVSGLGLSQMGRRTGRSALDLTLESCAAAIQDAGLERSDIDGVATVGETPVGELQDLLRLDLNWQGGGQYFGG
jgi:acetyl-CoA acetyltransferase